jgi:hypothetical protein
LSASSPEYRKSGNEHTHTLDQQSGTKRKVEIHTPSISKFFNERETELGSLSPTALENNKAAAESRSQSADLSLTAHENKRSGDESRQKTASLLATTPENNREADELAQRSENLSATRPEDNISGRKLKQKGVSSSVTAAESGKLGEKLGQKSASLSVITPESNRSENEHVRSLEQQSGTKRKVDISTPSILKFFGKEQATLKSIDAPSGPLSHSKEMEQNNMHKPTQVRHSIFNKTVRSQSAPGVSQGQKKTAASKNVCTFNLLSREERSTKLQELVSEVKKKHDDALKSKLAKGLFSREPQEGGDLKDKLTVQKRTGARKPPHPALLVNGKRYRARLKRPKPWVTPRLYKLLIPKCEEKYGMLKSHRKAEEFVELLCKKVCNIIIIMFIIIIITTVFQLLLLLNAWCCR